MMLGTLAPRLTNVALRVLTLGSKFFLIFALAKYLQPAEVGLYGLFVATVSFSMILIGGDYYTYAQRELLSGEKERWSFVIKHHFFAACLLYLFLLPPQLLIFYFDLLPTNLSAWFFSMLVLEHLSQEINRLLVCIGRPITATWVLFFRMGAWIWPLILLMSFNATTRSLDTVLTFFVVGELIAIALGITIIWKAASPWKQSKIDFSWIKRGFRVGFIFLGATLSVKALTTADRYVFEHLAGPDLLGAYILYIGLAMAVLQFVEPAIVSFLYPRIVSAYKKGNILTYHRLMKEMAWSSIALSITLACTIALFSPFLILWIGKPIYSDHISLLWMLLGIPVVYSAGLAPHFALYARNADRSIAVAHISSLGVFFISVSLLAPLVAYESTAYALLAAFAWNGSVKQLLYRYLCRKQNHQPTFE